MWVLFGLLPPVIVIGLIIAVIVTVVRTRSAGGMTFPSIMLGYVYAAIFVSVFLVAAGGALLLKAGLAEGVGRDFAYRTDVEKRFSPGNQPPVMVDPSDNAIRNDVATGITLAFVGSALFAIHGIAAIGLRRRRAPGLRQISRTYNLLGLAGSTIIFLAGSGASVYETLRRYVLDTGKFDPWNYPRPGGAIGVAIAFLPVACWFAWRVWQEFAEEVGGNKPDGTPTKHDVRAAVD
jgi:hypothetical protein